MFDPILVISAFRYLLGGSETGFLN